MNDKCFFDTNIFIYSYTDLVPDKQKKAQLLIKKNAERIISTQVLHEFVSAFRKKMKAEWAEIESSFIQIKNLCVVHINDVGTAEHAIELAKKNSISYYDALMVAAALECNCTVLYSEDMRDGQVFEKTLTVVNPFR